MSTYRKARIELEQDMRDEFGYIFCRVCEKSNAYKFDVHHIMFRSEVGKHKDVHNKRNLIIVCRECHQKLHADKSLRDGLVKERNLKELFNL